MSKPLAATILGLLGGGCDVGVAFLAQDYVGAFLAGIGMIPWEGEMRILATGAVVVAAVASLLGAVLAPSSKE